MKVWTIGHSTRSADEFTGVLAAHGIELVADVRRFPGSRRHPHFGGAALQASLAAHGVDYTWLEALGGRRREPTGPDEAGWRNASFRSYAAYMRSEDFAHGLQELLHLGFARRCAIMCSELLWWRCHRALISDALCFAGFEVVHVTGTGPGKPHPYTAPARLVRGELVYPSAECCEADPDCHPP